MLPSLFQYVDLFVTLGGATTTVQNNYGKEMVGEVGGEGPPRSWADFMRALLAEVQHRSEQTD